MILILAGSMTAFAVGGRIMQGGAARSGSLFGYVDLEARVPKSHRLSILRWGRPIPPEMMLRAML
jgi:hypothetical protein